MENTKVFEIIYDVLEEHIRPELKRLALSGGSWDFVSSLDIQHWYLSGDVNKSRPGFGARLDEIKGHWKIYNEPSNSSDELYNIIVEFNDDDEITNVEYINDSECIAFDKDFMYAIYEDLKKYEIGSEGNVDSEHEAESIINEHIEKESIDTSTTIDNSYEIWKKSLKIINVPKFDLSYFQCGAAYCVRKHAMDDDEFNGIMVGADENTLKILKRGTGINYGNDTEIIEITLKEYMNGRWYIVRLIKEEK